MITNGLYAIIFTVFLQSQPHQQHIINLRFPNQEQCEQYIDNTEPNFINGLIDWPDSDGTYEAECVPMIDLTR